MSKSVVCGVFCVLSLFIAAAALSKSNQRLCLFGSLLKNKADAAQNEQGARAREPP
jgi:hypothetical protein